MNKIATILLAEDEENDVHLMRRAMEKAGVTNAMQVVSDGEEVLRYIQGEGKFADRAAFPFPTLLLLDRHMPMKNGFEVLEWIRSKKEFRRLPVVILSAFSPPNDVRRAYDLGVNSYVTKPAEFGGLVDMMKMMELNWLKLNTNPPF